MNNPLFTQLMAKRQPLKQGELPFISVVTPTWNRRAFLPYLLYMFQYQDYPADRRELVILDDSAESSAELVATLTRYAPHPELIRYYHLSERLTIGAKRNRVNELARGEYIVCMDDDDFYRPDKLSYTINEMRRHNALFAGCHVIPIWYSHVNRIFMSSDQGKRNVLNGTFAYHRNFLKKHRYDDSATLGEEQGFTHNFTAPVLLLDPWRSILCVSHSSNTFDKDFVLGSCEAQHITLDEAVPDAFVRKFYQRLHQAPLSQQPDWMFFHRVVLVGEDDALLSAFNHKLLAAGLSAAQVECMAPVEGDARLTHLAVTQRAQRENWPNYLLLDSRLDWVRQQRCIDALNRLLRALKHISWDGFHLAAEIEAGNILTQLPGVISASVQSLPHLACCVNQQAYAPLIERLQDQLAKAGYLNTADLRWFALYPSMFFRSEDDDGQACTARFFRKLGVVPHVGAQEPQ
ncbi:glycosyltransferase family 2 protein [Pantoea nemavictus]|uniref:Glycosyltransferase family 2 protein n=1 Tax=Pantoea nemavictus TaxID=2726955 RepID=A0ABU8PQB6_9GAMM|nr:glycosyltransferase family 2 protein [Pantoea nemavictus]